MGLRLGVGRDLRGASAARQDRSGFWRLAICTSDFSLSEMHGRVRVLLIKSHKFGILWICSVQTLVAFTVRVVFPIVPIFVNFS